MTVKRGTDNIRNRLSEEDVMTIYEDQHSTQHALAKQYNISQSSINHIKNGRTWQWLTKHGE